MAEAVKASQLAAARYLVVDALNPSLIGMYEKFGFHRAHNSDGEKTRLSVRIKDLAASLGL